MIQRSIDPHAEFSSRAFAFIKAVLVLTLKDARWLANFGVCASRTGAAESPDVEDARMPSFWKKKLDRTKQSITRSSSVVSSFQQGTRGKPRHSS